MITYQVVKRDGGRFVLSDLQKLILMKPYKKVELSHLVCFLFHLPEDADIQYYKKELLFQK